MHVAEPGSGGSGADLRAGGYHIHYDLWMTGRNFIVAGAPWYSAAIEREMVTLAGTVSAVSDQLAQKFETCGRTSLS